ncbi:MAG TPA: hypothetical protein VGC41_16705, partial [Kofleriaceae bacterium]
HGQMESYAGDRDREVRAIASAAVPANRAQAVVQQLGARADATTVEPLVVAAWASVAQGLLAEPNTRAWSAAIAVKKSDDAGKVAQLIAIATASGEDPSRLVAIAALGQVGGEAAKAALEQVHGDEGELDAVKLAAWKALKRLLRMEARAKKAEGGDKPDGSGGGGGGGADGDGDDGDDDDGDDDDDGGDSDDDDDVDVDDAADDDDSDDDDSDDDGDDDGDDDDGDDDDDESDDDDSDDDSGSSASHGDGVIQKTGITRDEDFMYYVKGQEIWRVGRRKPGSSSQAPAESVCAITVPLDLTKFLYYVNEAGDLAAKRRR